MSDEEKSDVIVVGGGMSGLACAYALAKEGKEVLLIERGESVGSKNLTGGRVYTHSLRDLLGPELLAEAPLERPIVREQITMVNEKSGMTIDYSDYTFLEGDVPQSYSICRAVFDEWFAGKCEEEGVMVYPGFHVLDVIEENGKVTGVKVGMWDAETATYSEFDEFYADVVVAADGVNSFIAQKAGLRNDITAHHVGVGVKEIIEMPEDVLSARFALRNNEGAARLIVGVSNGVSGGGFLYTNKSSISLGLVLNPEELGAQKKRLHEIMQDLKMHPAIYPLLEGGTTVEYGAHLVPEAGYNGIPKRLYKDVLVVVGDAAGFVINMGSTIRGMDLAVWSGVAAARAICAAKSASEIGPIYMKNLEEKLLPTMKVYAGFPGLLEIPRMFTEYPKMANEMLRFMFAVDGSVPERLPKGMLKILKNNVSFGDLLSDGWKGLRSV